MTNKELQDILKKFPDNTPIKRFTSLEIDGYLSSKPEEMFKDIGITPFKLSGYRKLSGTYLIVHL